MGIESDKLVYDYLSKVGDLAQTSLPAAQRVRLVTRLRDDIDKARGKGAGDSPAAVRRILGKLGTPGEVIEAAAGSRSGPASGESWPAPEPQPAPRPTPPPPAAPPSAGPQVPSSPPAAEQPAAPMAGPMAGPGMEWWRAGPAEPGARTNEILGAGWTGGLIMPEFEPPAAPAAEGEDEGGESGEGTEQATGDSLAKPRRRGLPRMPRLLSRRRPAPAAQEDAGQGGRRRLPAGPMELLAALVLVAGAVFGNAIVLIAGWLLAYTTRGISRNEAKFAALGVPGVVTIFAMIWLWGRTAGHWGSRLSPDQFGATLSSDVPTLIRVAAVASALYLVWRGVLRRR